MSVPEHGSIHQTQEEIEQGEKDQKSGCLLRVDKNGFSLHTVRAIESCFRFQQGVTSTMTQTVGIDMGLHLVSQLTGRELALRTARQMEFDGQESNAAPAME
jgi:hypothetical protein